MFKKFVSISLATLLAFNLSACASKDISKNQKKSSSQNQSSSDENYADCESIDFSNVVYNDYGGFNGITFDVPDFLEHTSDSSDGNKVEFFTANKSCYMSVEYAGKVSDFKSVYDKDLANSENVGFNVFEDYEYRISGDDGKTVYYKCSIIFEGVDGYYLQNLLMVYPKKYEKEFDPIVTRVYHSFVKFAGPDKSLEEERNSSSLPKPDGKDKIISISDEDEVTFLGNYDKNKKYDIDYCSVVGKDVYATDSTYDYFGYNQLNLYGCSLKYPDFLRFIMVPDAKYGIVFNDNEYMNNLTDSPNVELNVISTFNLDPDSYTNASEYAAKHLNDTNNLSNVQREISGNYIYSIDSVSEPNRVISFSIDYIDEDEEDHVTFHVSPEYYNRNKDTFLDIFEVMKKSFNHEDNFEK